jgi:hypothetical protein
MTDPTAASSEEHVDESLAPDFSDDALELAAETMPINRSSILSTFNDPTQLCCWARFGLR